MGDTHRRRFRTAAFLQEDGKTTWRTIDVAYVKLSASDADSPSYPAPARREWERSKAECGDKPYQKACFPQDPTTDRDFSEDQFEGYRDLGYGLVRIHQCELMRALGLHGEACPVESTQVVRHAKTSSRYAVRPRRR